MLADSTEVCLDVASGDRRDGALIVSCAQPQVRASRRYLRRGWHAASVGVALVAAVGIQGPASVAAAGGAAFHAAGLVRLGTVVVHDLPATPSPGHPGLRKPFLSPRLQTPATSAPAHGVVVDTAGSAVAGGTVTSTGTVAPATASATTTSATTPTVTTGFPVWSSYQSQTTFKQGWTPPDTQLAAGPADLMEMINDVGSVWSKSGSLSRSFDLNTFFKVPSGQTFSDPRVVYDAPSGRWFATGLSFNSSYGSQIYIAVSSTSDPSGIWTVYSGDSSSTVLHDQPKVGVSADKVVMAWNDFMSGAFFQGSVIWVIQKSDLLLAASPLAVSGAGPDGSRPSIAPAQNLSYDPTTNTAYAVYNHSPNVGLLTITGTPKAGTVAMSESDPYMGATTTPPKADQLGYPGSIDTGDTRFLTATWQGGTLWTSANDGCGTVVCARLVAVSTSASPPSVTFSQDLTSAGGDLYYPAVTMDQSGDMAAVYTVSSTSTYPNVRVIGATLSGSSYTLLSGQTVNSGANNIYSYGSCLTSPPCRWGDYSGAAVDPSNPNDVWVTGEYSASNVGVNNTVVSNNWGTYTARLTVSGPTVTGPTVTGLIPSSGAAGTAVTVSGTGFSTVAGATTVSFGTVAGTQVACSSTTTCTAVAPAGSGTVDVTVKVNGQTSAISSSDRFSYVDFTVSASPNSVTVVRGGAPGSYSVTATPTGAYAGTVVWSVTGGPVGVTFTFSPPNVTLPTTTTTSTLTVSATRSTPTGTFTLTITGSDGSASRSTTVTLTIKRK
jgi:IPT/TIG domain